MSLFPQIPVLALRYLDEKKPVGLWVVRINAQIVQDALNETKPQDLIKAFETFQRMPTTYAPLVAFAGPHIGIPESVLDVMLGPNWEERFMRGLR